MKVLVIYKPDLPGRTLVERLRESALEVTPLLLSQPDDVSPQQLEEWIPPDIDMVVNMLTMMDPAIAEQEPDRARHRLLEIPRALVSLCAQRGTALLQLSSCYVFDGRKQSAYIASNPGRPLGQMGLLMWEAEQSIRAELPRHLILRTGWYLRRFCRLVAEQGEGTAPLYLSGRYQGQPVSAADLARVITAMLLQVDCGAEVWGTYQYAGLEETSLYDLGVAIAQALGRHRTLRIVDENDDWMALEPRNATLDCRKIRNTFGIKPRSWQEELPEELRSLADESPALADLAGT